MITEVEDKTKFKFSELSDSAKDKARDAYRSGDYPGYDWWDNVYEDAVRMGALMGVEISTTHHAPTRPDRKGYDTTDISFSGFYNQGDGASFEGLYLHVPDAAAKVTAECNDEELIRIAQELTLLQLTRRLQGFAPFSAQMRQGSGGGNYCHSGAMSVGVECSEEDHPVDEIEAEVIQLMRDFADWVYKQLEGEYEYLTSDEYIDERLTEGESLFDEDGREI